jgi:hypothetical protein
VVQVLILALAAGAAAAGCGSTCGANCPTNEVRVQAANITTDIAINDLAWAGPACPHYGPVCGGDGNLGTTCTHVDIIAAGPGSCDLLIVFGDRPSEIVHAEFGPPITQGCCAGYSVVGDAVFVIPTDPTQIIYGADGGSTDAVTVVPDASADGPDGGADAAVDAPTD